MEKALIFYYYRKCSKQAFCLEKTSLSIQRIHVEAGGRGRMQGEGVGKVKGYLPLVDWREK